MSPSSDSAARRAESREQRRASSRARNEHTDGDDVAESDGESESNAVGPALRGAAAAAAVGAALGAARALSNRDDDAEDEGLPDETEPGPDSVHDDAADEPQEERATPAPTNAEQPPPKGASSEAVRSVAAQAREQFRELHGKDPDSLSALERLGGGGWRVTLEVVEVERVPDSTDVLATYVIELDGDGRLTSYERLRRYYRAQADLGEGR
jgi:Gas vesicle synthesis protein GvpO